MLILKGNFPSFKLFGSLSATLLTTFLAPMLAATLAAVLAFCAGPLHAAPAGAAPSTLKAPDAVAAEFYGWYLDTLSADQDPLSDRYERFNTYVAKALVDQLAARLRSGPAMAAAAPASDYFLKVASYRTAWLHARVHALTVGQAVRQGRREAEVIVTLGEGSDARQVLGLGMVLENGAWKIRQVVRADPESAESSIRPSTI